MKQQKIILNTNLWISFLITNKLNFIEELFENKKTEILYSAELINELESVIKRPKFKKYFSAASVELLLDFFLEKGIFITVSSNKEICRDQKDNFLLNLSVDGKADYLITGDKDLLILKQIEQTEIITIANFINTLPKLNKQK
jgi:putative PIN family toxin of toxin-antitoxin system